MSLQNCYIDPAFPEMIAIVLGPIFGTGNAEYIGLKASQVVLLKKVASISDNKNIYFSEDGTDIIKWKRDGSVIPNRIMMRMGAGWQYGNGGNNYTYSYGAYCRVQFQIGYGRQNSGYAPTRLYNSGNYWTYGMRAKYALRYGMSYSYNYVPHTGQYYPNNGDSYKYCYLRAPYTLTYGSSAISTMYYHFKDVQYGTERQYGNLFEKIISALMIGDMRVNVTEVGAKRVEREPIAGFEFNVYAYENVQVGDPEWMTSNYRERFYGSFWDYEFLAQDDVLVEDYLYPLSIYTAY